MDITVERIVSVMKSKKITALQFAADLKLNRVVVSDWKSGKSKSYLKHINAIADYLDTPVEYLLGREDLPPENTASQLFDHINTLCLENKITFAKLERTIGLSNGSISKWSRSSPSVNNVQKVADYFNVSVDFLLGRTDDPKMENGYEIISIGDKFGNEIDITKDEEVALRAYLRTLREEKNE